MKKKLISLLLCTVLVLAMIAPSSAANNDIVLTCTYADTSHPYAFFTSKSTSSPLINQYTAGKPTAGTPLTTWKWTGDTSQWFEYAIFTTNGGTGDAWCIWGNPHLVINCKRVGSAPEVNIENAICNYGTDIAVYFPYTGVGKFRVSPRSVHTQNMYITIGAPMSGGNYLNWTTSGTFFYQYDVGAGQFIS